MEHVGYDTGRVHGTVHTEAFNHLIGSQNGGSINISIDDWHVYEIIWDEDKIYFIVDGLIYHDFENSDKSYKEWPFDQKFHLIMNIAVGGSWGGQQGIDATAFEGNGQVMEVDWVRVYDESLSTSPTKSPTQSPTTSPTQSPTTTPTQSPTTSPTQAPTTTPTQATSSPTQSPTTSPTQSPTISPTQAPTTTPTQATSSPTQSPTTSPTQSPTISPTQAPTTTSTQAPTTSPSSLLSVQFVQSADNTMCLQEVNEKVKVLMCNQSEDKQVWIINPNGYLRNKGTGKCLNAEKRTLALSFCNMDSAEFETKFIFIYNKFHETIISVRSKKFEAITYNGKIKDYLKTGTIGFNQWTLKQV